MLFYGFMEKFTGKIRGKKDLQEKSSHGQTVISNLYILTIKIITIDILYLV